ncbi:putative metal-dependent hydrolase [Candidatus Termititenax aidoneus]|uniref:Metal-dependent hydrolase n=1 Tax=Termititenax aidoneus TaxID=2218524 RepID=A0A388T9K9_TERA1|nr:putative metal-dependent hydrolase [Candidatus Termititenax aidoneus]
MLKTAQGVPVLVRKNRRARRIKLYVTGQREVKLTLPWYAPLSAGAAVVKEKEAWIEKTLAKLPPYITRAKAEIEHYKTAAFDRLSALAEEYAVKYGVTFRNIRIGDQTTRWGSCSRSGTLSFNWRLALMPENIRRYIVIHELCHLKEMNHSPRFWSLVAERCPEHSECRKWLRKNRDKLI